MSDISNLDKDFGSKWFGVANLGGRDYLDLTIQNVWIETMQDGEEKIAVNFRNEESGKAMLFNKVIYKTMRQITGTDNGLAWIDKTIRVFRTTADYQGTTHDVLRIRAVTAEVIGCTCCICCTCHIGSTSRSESRRADRASRTSRRRWPRRRRGRRSLKKSGGPVDGPTEPPSFSLRPRDIHRATV
jgi:hypothetical protein